MLPNNKALRDLLIERLDRDVEISRGEPFIPGVYGRASYAVYVDRSLRTVAVAATDLPFAAFVGAAAGLATVGGAHDAIERSRLSPAFEDDLRDVFAECAGLFPDAVARGIRLYDMYAPGVAPPDDIPVYARVFGQRLDLRITVAAYGRGRFSIVRVPPRRGRQPFLG
jgi:hypothetical protein